ncbi:CRISPR type I-F/YPEST-associated protein Csy1 [Methylophaga frappieri]|uniref:CRISPR type I-F/YPEST-associated protein Csy1 n=1 Tax=Methylophaga frappieri (strain ATCC BAA-2434 / DSM 25690 / JAM7) TaxID=754477 RepID=I1YH09_METFJ|nr:type I-F CRISPR-associated protein Csy1 [Methylophaga frappieri]AFJ02202.1 CRISPR type I-F/YPEST-associated protein Csy1 [Methylophaga frappieri]
MLDPAIDAFFAERKEGWLKKKLKPDMTNEKKREIELECEEEFSLEKWLPNAAKRAGQISISTHPCTFSHPSSRKNKNGYATSVIAKSSREPDGYLRTGNVDVQADALGNAAALDVHKFLSLVTEDGSTVIEHIEQDSELGKTLLNTPSESYANLKSGFMAMARSDDTPVTSSKIKQVYFPADKDYHQLSILSNSGMIFELRRRIDALRFSDAVKEGRELRRNNTYSESGYSEIYDITTIGYGGTKPQNVSVLNNQNGGKAHLLLSVPPLLEQRDVRFPARDFFIQSLRYYDCKDILERLDKVFKIERDGQIPLEKIRKGRDRCLGDILDVILQKMMALRDVSTQQYWPETSKLRAWQKLWLCEQHKEQRLQEDDWLNTLCDQIARWIVSSYKNSIKHPVMLGEAEHHYIKEFIEDNKEVLR